MIDKLLFLNDTWIWPVLLGGAVLLLVFIWKEWVQFGGARFYIKVLVAFLAILSLAMIALRPAFLNNKTSGDLIILTNGYEQTSFDSLKKEYNNIKSLKYTADVPITKELAIVDSVFILGHGIKRYDLWQLEGKATKYIGGVQPTGIIRFNYQQELVVGDQVVFKGIYSLPIQGTRLVLEGAGGQGVDSVILHNKTEQQFKLKSDLIAAGNFVFKLVEKDSMGIVITSNPIPIKVFDKEAIKILMINGFPTFETKYLKNFLAEMDHEVIIRSRVTKGKYKYEFFNTEKTAVGKLSEKLLESFDLLVIDYNSLKTLSTSEKNGVEKSIRKFGLGVFIQPEVALFRSNSGLASFNFALDNIEEARLNENLQLTKYPYSFEKALTLQPIQTFGKQILAASHRMGQGKVGTSVLENTYGLLLDGYTSAYQQFWTNVINGISKRAVPKAEWSSGSRMGIINEPFQFQVRTLEKEPIIVNSAGAVIPLRQKIDFPNLWTGITYPKNTGWQHLSLQQDSAVVYNYFVSNSENWNALRDYETIQENLRFSNSKDLNTKKTTNQNPINLLYFYLLFLLSLGYLWLEPKMRSY